ncbi:hypothetical protein Hanom_Chr10g00955781 [Helianthus anomalus]
MLFTLIPQASIYHQHGNGCLPPSISHRHEYDHQIKKKREIQRDRVRHEKVKGGGLGYSTAAQRRQQHCISEWR